MPISTATIIAQADETFGFDNLSPLAGTWRNLFWDTPGSTALVWGIQRGKFTFDFERVNLKFTNLAPTIPEDAIIISAILRGTAQATSTPDAFFTVIRTLATDGIWNPVTTSGWKSASSVGGPFGTLRTAADVVVLNTAVATLVDTAVGVTHFWPIRDNINLRGRRAGQGVDVVTGGTLGFADITLKKTGTGGAGNIWCEIYSQDANGLADTLLATSDTRPASAAPTTAAPVRFTFSGPEQIALSAAQKIVVVLNADYPVSDVNNVGVSWTANAGYPQGTFQLDGTGRGFNEQNSPMQMNFRNVPGTGFIIWVAPQFFVGVDFDTPDFSAMLQSHIQSGYVEGDPIGFSVERSLFLFPPVTADRRWASSTHGTFQPVRLIVEWIQQDIPKDADAVVSSDVIVAQIVSDLIGGDVATNIISSVLTDTSLGAGVILDRFGAAIRSPIATETDATADSDEIASSVSNDELSAEVAGGDLGGNLLGGEFDATIAIDSIDGEIIC